jgi:hypothetical protein
MESLGSLQQKGDLWRSCLIGVAESVWEVPDVAFSAVLGALKASSPSRPTTWEAIVDQAPAGALPRLEDALGNAYRSGPGLIDAMQKYASRRSWDLKAWLVRIARDVIDETAAKRILVNALESRTGDPVAAGDSATLAGTIWPEDPAVTPSLERMEKAAASAITTGSGDWAGPVLLRARAWSRLVHELHDRLQRAAADREEAVGQRDSLVARLDEQSQLLEERRQALQTAKTQGTQSANETTQRLAANLFKPVASALADSYESSSLAALQDQLAAAMARLNVHPIAKIGDIVAFDPDHHSWIGEGYPQARVKVLTPGFAADIGGGDELVLAFARVGPADDAT